MIFDVQLIVPKSDSITLEMVSTVQTESDEPELNKIVWRESVLMGLPSIDQDKPPGLVVLLEQLRERGVPSCTMATEGTMFKENEAANHRKRKTTTTSKANYYYTPTRKKATIIQYTTERTFTEIKIKKNYLIKLGLFYYLFL